MVMDPPVVRQIAQFPPVLIVNGLIKLPLVLPHATQPVMMAIMMMVKIVISV